MKKVRELTERQKKFLEVLFDKANGDPVQAKLLAGYSEPIGTAVSEEQVQKWFEKDVQTAINDCQDIFNDFDSLPEDIQHVLINMAFQLGGPRLRKFKLMIAAVEVEDYREMSLQMEDSRWFKQTPNRAQRLIDRVVRYGVPI